MPLTVTAPRYGERALSEPGDAGEGAASARAARSSGGRDGNPPARARLDAPAGTLPGIVALEIVLARSLTAAVYLSRIAAYRSGFELDVMTLCHPDGDALDPLLFGPRRGAAGGLRLAVRFAGGAETVRVDEEALAPPPREPILRGGEGGGRGGTWRQALWVSPLPPEGALTFVCEWPAAGIEPTEYELDAHVVLDAARRALVIFDEEGRGGR